jgi:hypothetical protein
VESFAAEFGCFVNDGNEVLRTIRIYTNDGKMAATTTMAEKRAADAKVPVPLCASLSRCVYAGFGGWVYLRPVMTRGRCAQGQGPGLSYDQF